MMPPCSLHSLINPASPCSCRPTPSEVEQLRAALERAQAERDAARSQLADFDEYIGRLQAVAQAALWLDDAAATWFSSEYIEHPKRRVLRAALDAVPHALQVNAGPEGPDGPKEGT